ncbi:hypothetical protein ACTID9_21250 [Brevibacillus fluminis]|uniref:hypothetical protein n=1 Tax=Brevibacillus fluminis TaxID=511487 RepID=UPI003F89FDEC
MQESYADALTMPAGGWKERLREKNGNCAPKPHAARRVYLKDADVAQSVSVFFAEPGGHRKGIRSTFLQKFLRCGFVEGSIMEDIVREKILEKDPIKVKTDHPFY